MNSKFLACLLSVVLLAGCLEENVYTQLSEQEANEMLSLLNHEGIQASKRSIDEQQYAVTVPRELLAASIDKLKASGYPRNKFESIGEVFEKEGFISSPLEERARFNYAQSQELTRTLESIDSVVLARVHLAFPEQDRLGKKQKPSSASVFIKHHKGVDLAGQESQIKSLIVNSIEGLPYENVTVVFFAAAAPEAAVGDEKYQAIASTISMTDVRTILFAAGFVALLIIALLANKYFGKQRRKLTFSGSDAR